MNALLRRFLRFLDRLLYTPPVYCFTCREPMYPLWGKPKLCRGCSELLADPRQRTTNRVRVWPVETAANVRRIGARRG